MIDSEPTKRFLAWDTSSVTGVVSAFEIEGSKLREVVSWSLSLETSRHSERLLWSIDTVLQSAGWKLKDLSGIAVGVGPGSFTGLRIGVTTARMLASTLAIPVTPISSLALLAQNAVNALPTLDKTLVVACTDAAKGEWFTLIGNAKSVRDCVTFAEADLPGVWGRGVSESVMPPEEVFEKVKSHLKKSGDESKWIAIGQSVGRYADLWKSLPQKSRILHFPENIHQLSPQILSRLAFEAIQQGIQRPASTLKPRYLRDSEAEVKLRKGLLKLNPLLHRGGIA
jgi:tRNA threonylcarbamoyladenosine biosynthesis protein TsaB